MRPYVVAVVSPERQFAAGVIQSVEQFFIQQLVPQAAVERLDEGILLGFARIVVVPIYVVMQRYNLVSFKLSICNRASKALR
jgi:hypothetical protein